MVRYRLRTLLILLALGPPALGCVWSVWQEALANARRQSEREQAQLALRNIAEDLRIHTQYIPVTIQSGPTADLDLPFSQSRFSNERTFFVPTFDPPASDSALAP
jgi:hypothetical protein